MAQSLLSNKEKHDGVTPFNGKTWHLNRKAKQDKEMRLIKRGEDRRAKLVAERKLHHA